jgi:hypothetical protein
VENRNKKGLTTMAWFTGQDVFNWWVDESIKLDDRQLSLLEGAEPEE